MMARVSARRCSSRAVHCSVGGVRILKVGKNIRNSVSEEVDVLGVVGVARYVRARPLRLLMTSLRQTQTNATCVANVWMPVRPARGRSSGRK